MTLSTLLMTLSTLLTTLSTLLTTLSTLLQLLILFTLHVPGLQITLCLPDHRTVAELNKTKA